MNKKPLFRLSISLALLLYSCVDQVNPVNPVNPVNSNNKTIYANKEIVYQKAKSLSGIVEFPDSSLPTRSLSGVETTREATGEFSTKATEADISAKAIVSLIYPADYSNSSLRGTPAGTGISNASGQFTITPDASFNPQVGDLFILEASKRIGGAGNNNISLRTFIRWDGNRYESITTPGIYVNSKTTALAIISEFNSAALPTANTINKMSVVSGVVQVANLNTNFTATLINSVKSLVEQLLASNQDPVSNINLRNGQYIVEERSKTSTLGCVGEPGNCPTPLPTFTPYSPIPTPTAGSSINPITGTACIGDNVACPTPTPVGEFKVNTYATNAQRKTAIAMDSDGDFVVTWESFNQDGSNYGVYAQRYNNALVTQGPEFKVNTYTTGIQRNVSIAMDSDGDFVVTWESFQEGSSYGVYAQRYNNSGTAQGSEFRVNTYTTGSQRNVSVAMDSDGDFVVTWESPQDGASSFGIYAQRYNSTGTAQGAEFRVNTYTIGHQTNPSVAMNSTGDFVISWQGPGTGDSDGVYAQSYNSAGVAQGSEFKVNTYTTGAQTFSSLAMDSTGNFVISWQGPGTGDSDGVYAQRYNSAGVAQGSEFKVNTYTTGAQTFSSLAMDSTGNFVISWQGPGTGDSDGVYAQRYNSAGVAQGSEFKVNTYTTSAQTFSSIAVDSDGVFVISWNSFQDGSLEGIYAKRYDSSGNVK